MKILLKIVLLITVLISASVQAYLTSTEQQEIAGYANQAYTNPLYNNHRVKVSSPHFSSYASMLILNFDVDDKGYKIEDMRADLNNTMVKKIANHWCSYPFDSLIKKGLIVDLRFFGNNNDGKFMDNIIKYSTCRAIKNGRYKPGDYANNFNPVKEKSSSEVSKSVKEKSSSEVSKSVKEKSLSEVFKSADSAFTYSNGTTYEGDWKGGVGNYRHGQGTFINFKKGRGIKYVGKWKDDKMHGQGVMTYSTGTIFTGEWKNGRKHGQGEKYWPQISAKSTGEYKNNKKHGKFIVTFEDGRSEVSYYRNGKKVDSK
jgi:hypothetical protein